MSSSALAQNVALPANQFMASPSGGTGFLGPRALVAVDIATALAAALAAPPSIGSTTPSPIAATTLSATGATSLTSLRATGASTLGATGWLETIVPATESLSTTRSLSTNGFIGILGATRASDSSVVGGNGSFGGGFFGINDNTSILQTVHGIYTEVRKTLNAGSTIGIEINTTSYGPLVPISPYAMVSSGQSMGLWIGAGRPDVPLASTNVSAAIGIVPNGTMFDCGICFGNGSVNSLRAIEFPISYQITWRNTTNFAASSIIRSDVSDATHGQSLLFTNTGFFVQDITAANLAQFSLTSDAFFKTVDFHYAGTTTCSVTGSIAVLINGVAKALPYC
jgi:hypothetical protein